MLSDTDILILVILIIIVLVAIIATYRYKQNLETCRNTESPYCPCFVCKNGCEATRTGGSTNCPITPGKKDVNGNVCPTS